MNMYILAIESSCDDTSCAVLHNRSVLSNVTAGQTIHSGFGGVIPELASRDHQKNILPVANTDYQLTPKEKEILQQLVKGKSFKMIADAIGSTYETVRTHIKNIYAKLHVNSNTEAVSRSEEHTSELQSH